MMMTTMIKKKARQRVLAGVRGGLSSEVYSMVTLLP